MKNNPIKNNPIKNGTVVMNKHNHGLYRYINGNLYNLHGFVSHCCYYEQHYDIVSYVCFFKQWIYYFLSRFMRMFVYKYIDKKLGLIDPINPTDFYQLSAPKYKNYGAYKYDNGIKYFSTKTQLEYIPWREKCNSKFLEMNFYEFFFIQWSLIKLH